MWCSDALVGFWKCIVWNESAFIQALGSFATAAAVGVALWSSGQERRDRRREDNSRLFIVDPDSVGVGRIENRRSNFVILKVSKWDLNNENPNIFSDQDFVQFDKDLIQSIYQNDFLSFIRQRIRDGKVDLKHTLVHEQKLNPNESIGFHVSDLASGTTYVKYVLVEFDLVKQFRYVLYRFVGARKPGFAIAYHPHGWSRVFSLETVEKMFE